MIGYEMGSSPTGVYNTTVNTSLLENFRNGLKNDMVANIATFLGGEYSRGQVFWATSNPRTRNLAS